jgi:hypothetical protein
MGWVTNSGAGVDSVVIGFTAGVYKVGSFCMEMFACFSTGFFAAVGTISVYGKKIK